MSSEPGVSARASPLNCVAAHPSEMSTKASTITIAGGTCWAATLGDCSGPITGEHLVTDALFGRRVRIEGEKAPWLLGPEVEIPIRRLKANILCEGHNSQLGRTADASARVLLRALRLAVAPMELPGSRILRPPVERRIPGVWFGRWLCKTHCNLMVAAGLTPAPEYVRYAFGKHPGRHIFIYCSGLLGDTIRLGEATSTAIHYQQLVSDDDPTYDGFQITLGGFPSLVSLEPVHRNNQPLIDRLLVFQQSTPLGFYRITFDWTGEPTQTEG